jgi:hypothetical protein
MQQFDCFYFCYCYYISGLKLMHQPLCATRHACHGRLPEQPCCLATLKRNIQLDSCAPRSLFLQVPDGQLDWLAIAFNGRVVALRGPNSTFNEAVPFAPSLLGVDLLASDTASIPAWAPPGMRAALLRSVITGRPALLGAWVGALCMLRPRKGDGRCK